jgi:hypothetical protein
MPKFNRNQIRRRVRRGPCIATRPYPNLSTRFVTVPLISTFPSITSTWSLYEPTNLIRLGTDYNGRLGRQVKITKLQMKGIVVGGQSNLGTDDPRNVVRVVVALVDGSFTSSSLSGISLGVPVTNQNVTGLLTLYRDLLINLNTFSRDTTGYVPAQKAVGFTVSPNATLLYNDSIGGFSPVPRIIICVLSDSSFAPSPGFTSGFIQTYFQSMTL